DGGHPLRPRPGDGPVRGHRVAEVHRWAAPGDCRAVHPGTVHPRAAPAGSGTGGDAGMSPKLRYTLGALNIVGVPTLLFFTFINFYSSPLGGLVGVGLAAVLLAVVLWLLSRSPMWPERSGAGWRWVVAGLLWGAGVSFTFVMVGGV